MALVEPIVEAEQDVAGAGGGIGLALDHDAVAARGDVHAQAVLDHHQMAVVIAEQRAEEIGLLELELQAGAAGIVGADGGEVALGHQAATAVRRAPPRLLRSALVKVTSSMSPMAASGLDEDRLQPGRLADHLAGLAALAVDEDPRVAADAGPVEGEGMRGDALLELLQPVVHYVGRDRSFH